MKKLKDLVSVKLRREKCSNRQLLLLEDPLPWKSFDNEFINILQKMDKSIWTILIFPIQKLPFFQNIILMSVDALF